MMLRVGYFLGALRKRRDDDCFLISAGFTLNQFSYTSQIFIPSDK